MEEEEEEEEEDAVFPPQPSLELDTAMLATDDESAANESQLEPSRIPGRHRRGRENLLGGGTGEYTAELEALTEREIVA